MAFVPEILKSFFEPAFPRHAISISADYVASMRVSGGVTPAVENLACLPLASGVVVPSHSNPNILDRAAMQRALHSVVQKTGSLRKEVNLLIPDTVARVFVIPLEHVPTQSGDMVQLLQFRVKKSIPFPLEEAALAYQIQTLGPDQHEVVLTVMQRSILREYESAVEALGLDPGFVTVEHFGVAGLMEKQPADWKTKPTLLFRLAPRCFTTSIFHDGFLRFYRALERDYSVGSSAGLTAEVLFDEIYPSLAYFQDRFERRIEKILLSGLGVPNEPLCQAIQKLAECPTAEIRAERSVSRLASGASTDQVNQVFAPLIGLELAAA
ncbi:MAG: pilus assembly protein PilM [Acidobacteriia bacterium]|nr:pilus assembly protein PilM [Terriglobia bacterium]